MLDIEWSKGFGTEGMKQIQIVSTCDYLAPMPNRYSKSFVVVLEFTWLIVH